MMDLLIQAPLLAFKKIYMNMRDIKERRPNTNNTNDDKMWPGISAEINICEEEIPVIN